MDANRCIDDLDPEFEYTDANVSHKWLFTYPKKLMPNKRDMTISFTKETFTEPLQKVSSNKGKRKKLLEHFYRQIIAEELKDEFDSEEVVIEPYETEISENFKHPDDMPLPGECLSKNERMKNNGKPQNTAKSEINELKTKYPLYASRPFSFAAQTFGKDRFGKMSTITKPPEQNYDNIEY